MQSPNTNADVGIGVASIAIYRLMSTLELNLILLSMCLAFVCMPVFDVILLCFVCDLIRIIRFNLHVSGIFSFVSLSHD